jgi:60 kDa SS-A/Ro ribonucleoprotein
MVSTTLFKTYAGKLMPATDTLNEEFAPAYRFSARHALAQLAATGCLNATFYASNAIQLERVLALCADVEPMFIAQTALYARNRAFMKDMPALLCGVLSIREPKLLEGVFARVIDSGRMLRSFVQIMRSGDLGRKSLGSLPKRLIREWLEARSDAAVFRACVGMKPSLMDIIRMVHPRPASPRREALYGYLLGQMYDTRALPALVRDYEAFKAGLTRTVPDVPFEKLTGPGLGVREWTAIARHAGWHATRMNLNSFLRHGVLDDPEIVDLVASRLRDRDAIARARVFPYQLLVAYLATGPALPPAIREALQDALEIAAWNVPAFDGRVIVCPDVSGSMASPVTGRRKGATSAVSCVDAAALVAATVLRKNAGTRVIPFQHDAVGVCLNSRDSVMTNASRLTFVCGGGTNCSAPLMRLNHERARADLVIYVSDNQSWVDAPCRGVWGRGPTALLREWTTFRHRNPEAKLVCIDLQPYTTTQVVDRPDILNVGGFSDRVFEVIAAFVSEHPSRWIEEIESTEL